MKDGYEWGIFVWGASGVGAYDRRARTKYLKARCDGSNCRGIVRLYLRNVTSEFHNGKYLDCLFCVKDDFMCQ